MTRCTACGCASDAGGAAHRIVDALRVDDLDRAIDAGLLDDIACEACSPDCRAALAHARAQRHAALAARERYRDRALRLAQRQRERDARRAPTPASALPPAAAAALARAKARAAQRKPE